MTRPRSRPAIVFGLVLGLSCTAATADGEGTPLAAVHVNDMKTFANLPADAPRGVWYGFGPGHGHGLGCGLILRGGTTIVPLLEPGEDGEWPSCMGVPAATSFDWHGHPVYVYRYIQRDTREDSISLDAYVRIGSDGIEGVEGLAPEEQPRSLSIGRAAAWAKASLAAAEVARNGFVPSKPDTVWSDHAYLVIARNAASNTCSIHVDRLGAGAALVPVITPCKAILATTSLTAPRSDWLLAMTRSPDGRAQARVFEAGPAGVREATDVEAKLASTVAGGKILAVKAELKRLVGQ